MYFRYHSDPILNPLTPWDRPPIKNVFCIYGLDSKTEVKSCSSFFFLISNRTFIQQEKRKQPLQVFMMVNTKNSKQKQLKTE